MACSRVNFTLPFTAYYGGDYGPGKALNSNLCRDKGLTKYFSVFWDNSRKQLQ
jgi:hypothetical protein